MFTTQQVKAKSLSLISLCLVIGAAFAWYGATKDLLKATVKLPKGLGGGVAHDIIYATILTAISVWWSSAIAEPADIL